MSDKKSLKEVASVVISEGLGYAVAEYMSGDSIEDPKLAEIWDRAGDALHEIEAYLGDLLDEV